MLPVYIRDLSKFTESYSVLGEWKWLSFPLQSVILSSLTQIARYRKFVIRSKTFYKINIEYLIQVESFSCLLLRCSQNYDMRQSRCMSRLSDLKAANCRDDFILENKYKKTLTLRSDNLRDFDPDVDSVQIQPQHLQMSLRKGRQQIVKMKYKPARNYPLDLYYL